MTRSKSPPCYHRVPRLLAGVGLLISLTIGACSSGAPIEKQNCEDLVKTLVQLRRNLDRDFDRDTRSRARQAATELRQRVAELGGCPDQPSLQGEGVDRAEAVDGRPEHRLIPRADRRPASPMAMLPGFGPGGKGDLRERDPVRRAVACTMPLGAPGRLVGTVG